MTVVSLEKPERRPLPVGTVVRLKSGGPSLTVSDFEDQEKNLIAVEWFAGCDLRRDVIRRESLVVLVQD